MRVTARHIFEYALSHSTVDRAFQRHVECTKGVLRVCEDLYDLNSYGRVLVMALGKAANNMINSLEMQAGARFEGIVSTALLPDYQVRGFRYFAGGHPLPNDESVRAASAMLNSLSAQNEAALVIFLVSGGGSSMVEKPLDDDISVEDLVATYGSLIHSGAPIRELNAIRKHLSAVKGGRLALAASPAQQVSLLISDVPDDAVDALASGPTMPDSSSVEDCYAIVSKHQLLADFPASVRELFERRGVEETPKSDDIAFYRSRWWTLLSNATATAAAKEEAERSGFLVEIDNSCDDWDYAPAADYLLNRLRELRSRGKKVCLLSGGEVTVKVVDGGLGGRNQHFALACAGAIADEQITMLSAGTDGIDGNTPAAGAVVDGTTFRRATARGLEPQAFLDRFDSFSFFEALGDQVVTGPTGNNLRDLRIFLAY